MSPASARVAAKFLPYNPVEVGGAERVQREFIAGQTAQIQSVRDAIEALVASDALKRMQPEAALDTMGPTAQKISELSSNVIGVGMSPQLDVANKQLAAQEDMANSLRVLIERDAQQAGFTPNKFWPSARRLNLPR
jgi:hypothetical protein